jgi:hypothetical protein
MRCNTCESTECRGLDYNKLRCSRCGSKDCTELTCGLIDSEMPILSWSNGEVEFHFRTGAGVATQLSFENPYNSKIPMCFAANHISRSQGDDWWYDSGKFKNAEYES